MAVVDFPLRSISSQLQLVIWVYSTRHEIPPTEADLALYSGNCWLPGDVNAPVEPLTIA